jgi:hypothetical protein
MLDVVTKAAGLDTLRARLDAAFEETSKRGTTGSPATSSPIPRSSNSR